MTIKQPQEKKKQSDNTNIVSDANTLKIDSLQGALQELRTHQIELEMQNEELRQTQLELLEARDRFRDLYDMAPVGYLTLNPKAIVLDANMTFSEMILVERSKLISESLANYIHKDSQDTWYRFLSTIIRSRERLTCEIAMLIGGIDSEEISRLWVRIDGRPIVENTSDIDQIHFSLHDISEQRRSQDLLQHQAFYDTLTDLPNRHLFINRFSQYHKHVMRTTNHGALLYIDIDNFKFINDSFGHALGDKVLHQVGNVLRAYIRSEDTAARLGGDEFIVLLTGLSLDKDNASTEALAKAKKINAALREPLFLNDYDLRIEVSIGVALFPSSANSVDEIISCADIAMYRAKRAGKNAIEFFHQDMYDNAKKRLDTYQDLRHALAREEFELVYQPQVNMERRIIGAECLLRWQHPTKGVMVSDEFVPILEDSNLIVDAGIWVLTQACKKLVHWDEIGLLFSSFTLAVNVSPRQFNQNDFVEVMQGIIRQTGANPAHLVLEITENMLLSNVQATVDKMNRLKRIGITFSIDDFGTGYSSLSYIKRLPIDTLKIDQSFVRDIHLDGDNEALVDTILTMANHLKLNVIAEGVENEEELAVLKEKGCQYFQGYLFSKPISSKGFEQEIRHIALPAQL